MKVATRWNRVALAGALDPEDLVELVTANPGDTLAGPWGVPVGRLVEGGLADLACFTNVRDDPWRSVLGATERTCNSSSSADVRCTATDRCSNAPACGEPSRSPSPASARGS